MPFTAWKQGRKKQTQRQKNLFTMTSGVFVIIQKAPAFRDFWDQKGITKLRDHEF